MLLYILDRNFDNLAVFDTFTSYLWADRYNSFGDFEYFATATDELIGYMSIGNYIWSIESEHVMIIESREIKTDYDLGATLRVTGRSLESMLTWRVIWQQTILSGNLQEGIERLLNENIINPIDVNRKIPGFQFKYSTDPRITSLVLERQFTGDNIYDAIGQICLDFGLGFKINLTDNDEFIFSLYMGQDRSYNQITNPFVVFAPEFDNLINSNYFDSIIDWKNVALIAGEGSGLLRKTVTLGEGAGFDRRELYVDARDLSQRKDEETVEEPAEFISDEEYENRLLQRGTEKLLEVIPIETLDGDVDFERMYVFNKDFFIGDIVQIRNEFGLESIARITEVVTSHDESGYKVIPTFEKIE